MARKSPPSSFSAGRRWGIFFSVLVSIVAMASLVVMLNYLGARHFVQFSWSTKASQQLSLPTLNLLNSITNDVKITLYYDKDDSLYDDIADLLQQYHLANPKISVRTVDFNVDNAAAVQVKTRYSLDTSEAKNLIIYECNGQVLVTSGDQLANYTIDAVTDDSPPDVSAGQQPRYRKRANQFDGEAKVDADLIRVTGPALQAYYLTGNGEPPDEHLGQGSLEYSGFAGILSDNHISTATLSLNGTNGVPADCNLLIIVAPRYPLGPDELAKVRQYLAGGGRLFVMFNNYIIEPVTTGLESILAEWGVKVGFNVIKDRENAEAGGLVAIMNFNTNHPSVSPLVGSRLMLYPPRSVSPFKVATPEGQEAPSAVVLASTGPGGYVSIGGSDYPEPNTPVIAAVEKKDVKGVLQQGTTRIIVTGDAYFLATGALDWEANHDFAELAVRWLLDQSQIMGGVAPRTVQEYRVHLTRAEMTSIRWIFLGAMPGGVLLIGGLVWLRRRH